jgi:hypothetical protein
LFLGSLAAAEIQPAADVEAARERGAQQRDQHEGAQRAAFAARGFVLRFIAIVAALDGRAARGRRFVAAWRRAQI